MVPNQSPQPIAPPPPQPTPNFAEEEKINFELRREYLEREERVEQLKQILKLSEKRVAQARKEIEEEDAQQLARTLEETKKKKVAENIMLPTNQSSAAQGPIFANHDVAIGDQHQDEAENGSMALLEGNQIKVEPMD